MVRIFRSSAASPCDSSELPIQDLVTSYLKAGFRETYRTTTSEGKFHIQVVNDKTSEAVSLWEE